VSILEVANSDAFKNVKGVIRFCDSQNNIVMDGVVDGLNCNSEYKLSITEFGDVSAGCENLGNEYKNSSKMLTSDDNGRVEIKSIMSNLTVPEIIGRGACLKSLKNDETISCGIISRSASIFQNYKRICACSGKVLWDERDLPKIVRNNSK
jgi:copper chaperone for superoxide dismutase